MTPARLIILLCFVVLLVVPMVVRPATREIPDDALRLIIITPHNEQIRSEFRDGFARWVSDNFASWPETEQRALLAEAGLIDSADNEAAYRAFLDGRDEVTAEVVFNVPGGTSEIRKMLIAQYTAAIESGVSPGGDADMVFGGGSYEYGKLKEGVRAFVGGEEQVQSITAPLEFDQQWLDRIYGENLIGDVNLYDEQGYWFGTALSGFGLVYNRDVLAELGVDEPTLWRDLCDPRLRGWVALVNPAQSGSVTTAFETILKQRGWVEGWRIMRRAGANARYFSGSSLTPPTDVSAGDAAMGVSIDFYGRFQSQAILAATGSNRVGYVDPPGVSTIDPDPIAMLRGAPHPLLAKKFIEFVVSEQGQALWQFRAGATSDGLQGPRQFELRRMPIRRDMYDNHFDALVDQVRPYQLARPVRYPDRNFRSFIALIFAAAIMDVHDELEHAWTAIVEHPEYPTAAGPVIAAGDVTDPTLQEMLRLFDELPEVPGADGTMLSLDDPADLAAIKAGWLRGGFADAGLWPTDASPAEVLRRRLADQFRENYEQIVTLAAGASS